MADISAAHDSGRATAFVAAARDAALIRDVDPRRADLEGYLFPETYALPRHDAAAGAGRARWPSAFSRCTTRGCAATPRRAA